MLFLPSDADPFPTGKLKKVEKPIPAKPQPGETWKEKRPGIWENDLGQLKTGDMRPKLEESRANPAEVRITWAYGTVSTCDLAPHTPKQWSNALRTIPSVKSWEFI